MVISRLSLESHTELTETPKDEARCYLEPVLLNGAEWGSASPSQIREAASDLLVVCASKAEQGGIATNFGMWNSGSLWESYMAAPRNRD